MSARLVGLDLARFVAVAGMVVVHGWTDLVLLPLERSGAALPAGPEGPAWAVLLQAVLTDRARPLFVLLAGVGVTLMVARTGAGGGVLRLRAAFLGVLGLALLAVGWSDLVLVAYAVLFLLAVVLVRLPSPVVLVLAVAAWSLPVVPALVTGEVPDGGALPVLAEFGYFFAGVVLGRARLGQGHVQGVLVAVGGTLAAGGAGGLLAAGHPLAGYEVRGDAASLVLETLLTVGAALVVLGLCLAVGRRAGGPQPGRGAVVLRALAAAGAMPLTVYVTHALLWTAASGRVAVDLVGATAVGAGFLLVVVVAADAWARTGRPARPRRGPLEALLHRVSHLGGGPDRPGPTGPSAGPQPTGTAT